MPLTLTMLMVTVGAVAANVALKGSHRYACVGEFTLPIWTPPNANGSE